METTHWDISMMIDGRSQGLHAWKSAEEVARIVERYVARWGADRVSFLLRRTPKNGEGH